MLYFCRKLNYNRILIKLYVAYLPLKQDDIVNRPLIALYSIMIMVYFYRIYDGTLLLSCPLLKEDISTVIYDTLTSKQGHCK